MLYAPDIMVDYILISMSSIYYCFESNDFEGDDFINVADLHIVFSHQVSFY